jgi:pyruvate dehydrogenase E2 component (dihydrolipoamide acetyltransferase)
MESVIEFRLPALGENIEQGDLVRLMIAPGAAVSEGQAIMELETDKAVVEVPSSVSGEKRRIRKANRNISTTDVAGRYVAETCN